MAVKRAFNADVWIPDGCRAAVNRANGGLMVRLDDSGHQRMSPLALFVERWLPLRQPSWRELRAALP